MSIFRGASAPPPDKLVEDMYEHYKRDQYLREQQNKAQAMAVMNNAPPWALGGAGSANTTEVYRWGPIDKLLMRLNANNISDLPFDHIAVHPNPKGEETVIFLIVNGKPVTLLDDRNLFPSDRLIGQINLLR